MPVSLRPHRLLILNSLIIISGCIFLFLIGLGIIIALPDPCNIPGSLFFMVPSFWIGITDYRAVFRRSEKSTRHAGILLCIFGGFSLFGAITFLSEWLSISPPRDFYFLLLIIGLAFIGIYLLICGYQLRRWIKCIQNWHMNALRAEYSSDIDIKDPSGDPFITPPFQYSLRELLGLVAVIAAISGITAWVVRFQPPRIIEHATPEQAMLSLPEGASDVCCARGFRGTIAYEFTIDEDGFLKWVNSEWDSMRSKWAGIPLNPISNTFSIPRYTNWQSGNASGQQDFAEITPGYYYFWSKEDQSVKYGYDIDKHRAYYHYQPY